MPTIFLRIAWMRDYEGNIETDVPTGAGTHIEINKDGGEVCNFLPINGMYLGYARIQNGRNLRIERLGVSKEAPSIRDVTIVFFAKNPEAGGGQYIVGWYRNATLYREVQTLTRNVRKEHSKYLAEAHVRFSKLIKVKDRCIKIPKGPGESNAWYAEETHEKWLTKVVNPYMADPEGYVYRKRKKLPLTTPWQKDIELRKKVELLAMERVAAHYVLKEYDVKYVHSENVGWDLEAESGYSKLLLEVKGLSGPFNTVELTPNEYSHAGKSKEYRICIVSNTLDEENQQLDIYTKVGTIWINEDGEVLNVAEYVSAKFNKIK